jgi:8-oxo-dGTP pyrophosphatase MutT (NUDIX family)
LISDSFIDQLQKHLNKTLPAMESQYKMAGSYRPVVSIEEAIEKQAKTAGILILVTKMDEDFHFLMIQRTTYDGAHSGQMAFPGGKKEPQDASILDTAIRECYEEIGIHVSKSDILGALTPLFIPVSHFVVYPFLAYIDSPLQLIKDTTEVEEIYLFNIQDFFKSENIQDFSFQIQNQTMTVPSYRFKEQTVWGASAMILSEWYDLMQNLQD